MDNCYPVSIVPQTLLQNVNLVMTKIRMAVATCHLQNLPLKFGQILVSNSQDIEVLELRKQKRLKMAENRKFQLLGHYLVEIT